MLSFSLILFLVPSLISPPEPSLPEPASARGRLLAPSFARDCVERASSGADDGGRGSGDIGLDTGFKEDGWEDDDDGWRCCCFRFLRDDSLPLASDMLGEPGRLRLFDEAVLLRDVECLLGRPEGVFAPEDGLEAFAALAFSRSDDVPLRSSSFFRSSSFRRSVPVSSDSLCQVVSGWSSGV